MKVRGREIGRGREANPDNDDDDDDDDGFPTIGLQFLQLKPELEP